MLVKIPKTFTNDLHILRNKTKAEIYLWTNLEVVSYVGCGMCRDMVMWRNMDMYRGVVMCKGVVVCMDVVMSRHMVMGRDMIMYRVVVMYLCVRVWLCARMWLFAGMYFCQICGFMATIPHKVVVHQQRRHMEKLLPCDICNKHFSTEKFLQVRNPFHILYLIT